MATIHIEGIDRMGILQELIHEISINMSINIRNLNIEANQGVFTCNLVVRVSDAAIVVRMCRQIKKINGVKSAVRTANKKRVYERTEKVFAKNSGFT